VSSLLVRLVRRVSSRAASDSVVGLANEAEYLRYDTAGDGADLG
jgi:hypothetical protein